QASVFLLDDGPECRVSDTRVTEVGVEPTQHRLSTCRLCRLAYPVVQLQTWELNPASRLMRPGRAPARLQCVNSGDRGIRTQPFSVLSGATPAGWSTSPCRTSNQRLVGESNPYPQVDTLGSWPLDERAVSVPRVGIEPTLPARAAALQAAWRPTARPKAL